MKKIVSLLFVIAVLFTSCTGDQGPAGPPGIDGSIITSSAFEIIVNFNIENNFSYTESYGFEVLASDVTLVYILWEEYNGNDIWRLLPQSVHFDDGDLVYNFDFTQIDVHFFLDGTVNFATLGAEWTQDQVFRVVVIPADNVDVMDVTNLDEVMKVNNIESFEMK